MITDSSHLTQLREQFAALRGQGLRARDAAAKLDLSEGDVMAAHAVSHMRHDVAERSLYTTMPLGADWVNLLQGLENCGPVMALTRNDSVVHEKIGAYRNVTATGLMGMALGPEIDLRLFLSAWHSGFHVIEHTAKGEQHSLQFFDGHGRAVHKIHARPQTDINALEALVQRHARPEARPVFMPGVPVRAVIRPDEEIDALGLGDAWSQMNDTHQFFSLLKTFGVDRAQSFRLMEGIHTRRTPLVGVQALLEAVARQGVPIMVFAGNDGCLQIHTGAVHRIEVMGPWLNVLDDGFNLHLRHDHVAESWLVTKPTDDGPVTSVELFDEQGRVIAMFFGERKPGKPELPAWHALAHQLVRTSARQMEAA
jgi:putative hemin transport protein